MLYPPGSRRQPPPPPPEEDDPDLRALAEDRVNAKRAAAGGAPSPARNTSPFANVTAQRQNFGGGGGAPNQPRDPRPPTPTLGQGPQAPTLAPPAPLAPPPEKDPGMGIPGYGGTDSIGTNPPKEDDLSELARMQLEQQKEYSAREADLKASKARAMQQAEARAGLGGLGLSGGTAALVGDVSRVQDRGVTEDLMDLARSQRGEQFDFIKRQEALDDLEASEDRDVDGDGKVGGFKVGEAGRGDGDPDNNETAIERKKREKAEKDAGLAHGELASDPNAGGYGSIAGWHPGTNDQAVNAQVAAQAQESANIPLVGTYMGSDAKWNYFKDYDGKIVKVRR